MSTPDNSGTDVASEAASAADLAWIPDIAARLAPSAASKRVGLFHPIDPKHQERGFLTTEQIDTQIVCGGRGMGKSTLLLYRIRHLRDMADCVLVRAVPPYGFRLVPQSIAVPQKSFWQFSTIDPWTATWKFVLGALFAFAIRRATDIKASADKPQYWLDAFGADGSDAMYSQFVQKVQRWVQAPHDECVADLVTTVLAWRPTDERLTSLYRERIRPLLAERNAGGKDMRRWIVYVDGIDEAITDWAGRGSLLSADVASGYVDNSQVTPINATVLAQQVWANAQAGFALAAYQLREESNAQILAFGSIRSETFGSFVKRSGLAGSKLEHFVLNIGYPDDAMRSIFNYNVELMPAQSAIKVAAPGQYERDVAAGKRFCGYHLVYNRTVFGHEEDLFTLARRHTFGTPRGLMMLGAKVRDVKITERTDGLLGQWRNPIDVMAKVNERSIAVLEEHLSALFPPWDTRYEDGLRKLPHNLLSALQVKDANEAFAKEHPTIGKKLVQYLYECGLVGIPQLNTREQIVQKFCRGDERGEQLPEKIDYVMLHPALSAKVRTLLSASEQAAFYNRQIVVEPGAACPLALNKPLLRITCNRQRSSGGISASLIADDSVLFSDASHVGDVFLAVLAIATRFHGSGHVCATQFISVAERLALLKLIPNLLGKSRSSVDIFFSNVCSFKKHPEASKQATAITDANELLSRSAPTLCVSARYMPEGNTYALACRESAAGRQLLDGHQIDVAGLSTSDFVLACGPRDT